MKRSIYRDIPKLHKFEEIFKLDRKTVVIVGGAGKIGRQFGLVLSFSGASVAIMDLDETECIGIADDITSKTGNTTCGIGIDASCEKKVKKAFEMVNKKLGKTAILIYNVMAKPKGYYRPLEKYSLAVWEKVLDGNLTGAFLCCKEASGHMRSSGEGSIILTASTYGVVGPDQRIYKGCSPKVNIYGGKDSLNTPAAYSASKAGLIGLARHFATLWGKYYIRVNVLTPGGVYDGQEESFHKEYVKRTPLGRMAVWSDYNGAVLFLASDASRYMTGANLVVDGGWTAW